MHLAADGGDVFLDVRHLLGAQQNAQVAAVDDHGIGCQRNLARVLHRRGVVHLGHHGNARAAQLCKQLAHGCHVGRIAHARHREKIGALLHGKARRLAIGIRQKRQPQIDARQVHGLAFAQHAGVLHRAHHVVAVALVYGQLYLAVVEQHRSAGGHVGGKPGKALVDLARAARHLGCLQDDAAARLQAHGGAVFEQPGAYAAAAQLDHDGCGCAQLAAHFLQAVQTGEVLGGVAVAEVQPGHVHARLHKVAQVGFSVCGRA